SGTLVFGIAAALGSLCAHRIFELETCAFAAGLPSLRRAGRGGLLVGGALCVVLAALVGQAFAPDLGQPAVLALFAALGFGLAVFATDPANFLLRRHGFLTLLGFFAIAALVPELAGLAGGAPWAALPVALALGTALVLATLSPARRRERALTTNATVDRVYSEMDVRSGTWGPAPAAPRAGRAPFTGPRRTDFDWARVALHERTGFVRGGWIDAGLVRGAISCAGLLAYHWVATSNRTDGGGVIDRLLQPATESGSLALTPLFMALWVSIVVMGSPSLAVHDSHRPLSRARRARVAWLGTTLEDGLHLGTLLALLSVVAFAAGRYAGADAAPSLRLWAGSAVAVFALVPFARWLRLRFLDTARTNASAVRQGVVTGVAVTVLVCGSSGAVLLLRAARGVPDVVLAVVGLAVLALAYAAWSMALRRHHARRDLSA
ncbi:MAG: hypothetical protein JNK02_00855, partial [Planctomycetes bacterium]|nr:hypothetical protein [Planctomycetota bacterium]